MSSAAKRYRRRVLMAVGVLFLVVLAVWGVMPRGYVRWMWSRVFGGASVDHRIEQYGPAARDRLAPHFAAAGVTYPPARVVLVGIKDGRVVELWARDGDGAFALVRTYPVLGASGRLGPKLQEGDLQVPEGLYEIESLHPNSLFHLALRVNYPNDFDRAKGRQDGRADLGADIMIHGSDSSVGCLAMGDEAIEELFVLVADAGIRNTRLILAPVDFRTGQLPPDIGPFPEWIDELYDSIRTALDEIHKPTPAGSAAMRLELSNGQKVTDPTDEQVRFLLSRLDVQRDGEGFAILSRERMTYMQVSGDARRGFDLEYQEGSAQRHYRSGREDWTLDDIIEAMRGYRDGTIDWSAFGPWERITW